MIEVVKDPHKAIKEVADETLLVSTSSEYPKMCLELLSAWCEKRSLKLVVQDLLVCQWTHRYANLFPGVTAVDFDPLKELRDYLGVSSLPSDLSAQDVVDLDLLALPGPARPLGDAKSYILGNLVGSCWEAENIPDGWEHFTTLVDWHLESGGTVPEHRLIQKWIKGRKASWVGNRETSAQKAYEWLFSEPTSRAKLLLCAQILQKYDYAMREDWIRRTASCSDALPSFIPVSQIPSISRAQSVIAQLNRRAKVYWKHISDDTEIPDVLSQMSGELLGELEGIGAHLTRRRDKCTRPLLLELHHHFSTLESGEHIFDKLETLVAPPKPKEPDEKWGWNDWSLWVTQEYLRYREWLQEHNQRDIFVENYAAKYADWLYRSYPTLKQELSPLIYGCIERVLELVRQDFVVLWLVIDNLPWVYGFEFTDYLTQAGLLVENPIPRLSMLPSETETSKRALIGGRLPRDLEPQADYNKLVWNQCQDLTVRYASNEPSFDKLISKEAKVYLYQYDALDAASHRFDVHRKQTRRASLHWLAQQTSSAIQSLQVLFENVVGVVDSDHGSTLLPSGVHTLRLPPRVSKDPAKHCRFAFVPSHLGVDQAEWYFLGAAEFGLSQHCIVARGHSCIGRRPQFSTHGGLTPEETVVPHIEFKMAETPAWIPIEVRYEGNPIRPHRQEVINLKVRNLNQTRLSEFRLVVQGRESESINIHPEEEEAEVHDVVIQMPNVIRESEVIITGFATYIAHGRQRSEPVGILIPVRHIATEGDIDKMFEE